MKHVLACYSLRMFPDGPPPHYPERIVAVCADCLGEVWLGVRQDKHLAEHPDDAIVLCMECCTTLHGMRPEDIKHLGGP